MATTDNLNLPEPVRERLTRALDRPLTDQALPGLIARVQRRSWEEDRLTRQVELRVNDEGAPHFEGYASVFDVWYNVAGGPPYGWEELVSQGTFTKALREHDDTRFLIEHEGLPLARSRGRGNDTLILRQDEIGLHSEAPALDLRNPRVEELRSVMERGDADEMSFAFRVTRQEWNDDYTQRTVKEARLFDVSVVTYPANSSTSAILRADELNQLALAAAEQRSPKSLRLARAQLDACRGRVPA